MSRGLNKVMVIGHLGQAPELRYTASGRPVATFRIATDRSWKTPAGERRTETEWFRVVAWGRLAEICKEFLNKGQQVYVEGRLHNRHWEDAEGNKRSTTEIVASEMIMLGGRQDSKIDFEASDITETENEFPF